MALTPINKVLKQKGIEYFSFSVINKNNVPVACCNNRDWQSYYYNKYTNKTPPVKKYIIEAYSEMIVWDQLELDKEAMEYISLRNSVVKISSVVTMIKKCNYIITATFGSVKNSNYFLNFIKNDKDLLYWVRNQVLSL